MHSKRPIGYKDAGVNIDEADRAVTHIRKHARGTFTTAVLTDIGSFGGGYLLSGWKKPVLVSSADGVGTKLKIAFLAGRHDTIGEDLVTARVDVSSWTIPPIFERLREIGSIDLIDYRRTFNLGIGMILVMASRSVPKARAILSSLSERFFEIGTVVESRCERVEYVGGAG